MLKEKHVLVLGLGLSGQAAVQFLLNRKASVVGVDQNIDIANSNPQVAELCRRGMKFFSEDQCVDIRDFDFLVVSPGVPSHHPIYMEAKELGKEVIGEIELACREIKQKCLGITGTNGKTTVTLLTAHVLQSVGIKARALGNMGIPLTLAVDEARFDKVDVFVIELSSFQLETLTRPFLDAAVLLNITPDHLDRYSSMQEYAKAKMRIIENLKEDGQFFIEDKCHEDFHDLFRCFSVNHVHTYGYSSTSCLNTDKHDVYCEGKKKFPLPLEYQNKRIHDVENLLASFGLCTTLGISAEQFLKAFKTFKKPSHRMEFVRSLGGIHYYDDSKGTNIDAVARAVECLKGEIVLIAGGVDKGFPYTPWINAFDGKVKAICAIGQSKEKIKKDLCGRIPVTLFSTLEEAVAYAASLAKAGDNVLLSPGCSSFDMFNDYAHRGQEFQRIIYALKEN